MEKLDGDATVIPALVAAAEIFGNKVIIWKRIAEVVFDACTACHQVAPQGVLPNIMEGISHVSPLSILAVKALVPGIGRHAETGRILFVIGDDPRLVELLGRSDPSQRALVYGVPSVLQRRTRQR